MVDYRGFRLSKLTEPRFRHMLLLLFWPAYGLYFYAIEWIIPRDFYHVMWCPVDDMIPFNELFLIPYLFWFVYLVGAHAYTFFVDVAAFRRLMYNIIFMFGLTCVIFVVFPTCQQMRPEVFPRDNVLTRLTAWFYTTDTSTNVCPSLHVCGSFAAAAAFADTKRFSSRGWKAAHFGIAVLISVSTVFVKQHSVIDTVCGILFSAAAYWIVYQYQGRKASRRSQCCQL